MYIHTHLSREIKLLARQAPVRRKQFQKSMIRGHEKQIRSLYPRFGKTHSAPFHRKSFPSLATFYEPQIKIKPPQQKSVIFYCRFLRDSRFFRLTDTKVPLDNNFRPSYFLPTTNKKRRRDKFMDFWQRQNTPVEGKRIDECSYIY